VAVEYFSGFGRVGRWLSFWWCYSVPTVFLYPSYIWSKGEVWGNIFLIWQFEGLLICELFCSFAVSKSYPYENEHSTKLLYLCCSV